MQKRSIQEMNRLSIDDFQKAKKIPLTVVLDNVRSLHNIGSVFRTADAFRIESIYLCGISKTPPDAEIHKTALGAELTVKWHYEEHTIDAIKKLHEENYHIFAIEQAHGSITIDQTQLKKDQHYAIILGHEVHGVDQQVINAADDCIEIPQYGTKHSLNVSVTAGIVIYQLAQQLQKLNQIF